MLWAGHWLPRAASQEEAAKFAFARKSPVGANYRAKMDRFGVVSGMAVFCQQIPDAQPLDGGSLFVIHCW
jgi:hypothetical protein